jgi:hypothetical protein
MATVAINEFAKRHTPESKYSHFDGSFDYLASLAEAALEEGNTEAGYMDGVILANVEPSGFFTSVVKVEEGTSLRADFAARRDNEAAYVQVVAENGDKVPAASVQLVLYRHDILEKDGDASTDADYEVISINASPTAEGTPIAPQTWARNALHLEGGSDMNIDEMSLEDARKQLKSIANAIVFWNTHVMKG